MQKRLTWIDLAKGLGIILVVIGHAGRGLSGANIPDVQGLLLVMDRAIYAFHMPLFFILSGVTFGMRPPANIQPVLIQKSWRLFYSMAIWTYAFLALRAASAGNSNTAGVWSDLLIFPVPPVAHFWFLWALLVNMVVFAILRLAVRPVLSEVSFWSLAFALAFGAHFFVALPDPLISYCGAALKFSLAFTLGALIGASRLHQFVPSGPVAALAALLFGIGLWACTMLAIPVSSVISGSVLSVLFLLGVIALSVRFAETKVARFVSYLGLISLAIYVMHTMFSAGLRILLIKGGIDDMAIHLVLGVLIGLLGPLVVYLSARRFGLLRIFGLA